MRRGSSDQGRVEPGRLRGWPGKMPPEKRSGRRPQGSVQFPLRLTEAGRNKSGKTRRRFQEPGHFFPQSRLEPRWIKRFFSCLQETLLQQLQAGEESQDSQAFVVRCRGASLLRWAEPQAEPQAPFPIPSEDQARPQAPALPASRGPGRRLRQRQGHIPQRSLSKSRRWGRTLAKVATNTGQSGWHMTACVCLGGPEQEAGF